MNAIDALKSAKAVLEEINEALDNNYDYSEDPIDGTQESPFRGAGQLMNAITVEIAKIDKVLATEERK